MDPQTSSPNPTKQAQVTEVVETVTLRGNGIDDPYRNVRQLWEKDGTLLAEIDPLEDQKEKQRPEIEKKQTNQKQQTVNVLDKGYVRLVDVLGTDLNVVNAARVSYDKESQELTSKDKRLIKFLAREGHTSPFRHAMATFEVYAPLMVARQWWKYVVGSDHIMDAWNESSRRYITEKPTFHIPRSHEWRSKPEHSKQGSGAPLPNYLGWELTKLLEQTIKEGEERYNKALELGASPEQARLFLPAYGMYVRWRWTASLQSICHFLNQRLNDDAQEEIMKYAKAVYTLIELCFPVSVKELVSEEDD